VAGHLERLEESFQQIVAQKEAFAEAFYLRLCAEFPQVQPLFTHTDMHLQQHKLITTLAMIVSHLSHPEKLAEYVPSLGV
jgi:hemoglobin-like flavoprotein